MLVRLRANWFVNGRRIRRGNPPRVPVEVPDELRDRLPAGAEIVEDAKPELSPDAKPEDVPKSPTPTEAFKDGVGVEVSQPGPDNEMSLSEMQRAAKRVDPIQAAQNASAEADPVAAAKAVAAKTKPKPKSKK